MKFIAVVFVITLSDVAVCNQDFDDRATFTRTANTKFVRPQLDSNTYLSTFNIQPSLEKSQTFEIKTNSQSNDVTSYHVKQPSSLYTPSKSGYSRHDFRDFTTYNPQLSHLSVFLPLNVRESSSIHSSPLFPSNNSRLLRSTSRTGKQLAGFTGGYQNIEGGLSSTPTSSSKKARPTPFFISDAGIIDIRVEAQPGQVDYDFNHRPHIHSVNVECSKTMMTINIEFNRVFNGTIYSKGYYTNPECIYVKPNSDSTQYSFTLNLDSCGTQFINDFEGIVGQAYLENVLVLQNEPDIQEVWDAVRSVRCLWEGNINKALTVSFSVDMLKQEIVTFSGDTAIAKLDIQMGKGPFAPTADGFVKIGETMTLVVSVEGDSDFDLQVRDCLARDEALTNMLQLTDERGCILKPKLFGAFQKTNDTGNTGASIIAYAFFQAFKFPDVMDLSIECNVELCKTNCEPCPEANQQIEPGRRRRSVTYTLPLSNSANSILLSDPVRVRRRFKVIMLEDISTAYSHILDSMEITTVETIAKIKGICINNKEFYMIFFLMFNTLFVAIICVTVLYIKLQRICKSQFMDS